ncbi:hypothetical protein H2248_011350 [Termitomyces sp. 'cryptogamus']|nr:hypothetical protein H2248_011350 [Termitomyces sp. 'cryptogamus']
MNYRDSLKLTARDLYLTAKNSISLNHSSNAVPPQRAFPVICVLSNLTPAVPRSYEPENRLNYLNKIIGKRNPKGTVVTPGTTNVNPTHSSPFVVRPYGDLIKNAAELREGSEVLSTPRFDGRSRKRTIAAQGQWPPANVHSSGLVHINDDFPCLP